MATAERITVELVHSSVFGNLSKKNFKKKMITKVCFSPSALLCWVKRDDEFTSKRRVVTDSNFLEDQLGNANIAQVEAALALR